MKGGKSWLIIGAIIVIIVGGFVFAAAYKGSMPKYSQTGDNAKPGTLDTTGQTSTTAGEYVNYSSEAFANAEGRRWLFFHAGWCPQCRALEKDIQKDGVPEGVTILKVNYDSENSLKKKYGVTLQTTVVEVDAQGNEIKKFVAYDDPTLDAVIKALGS